MDRRGHKTLNWVYSNCVLENAEAAEPVRCVPEVTEAAWTDEDTKLSTGYIRTACWRTRKPQNPLGACRR
jgi:hypothetical protein